MPDQMPDCLPLTKESDTPTPYSIFLPSWKKVTGRRRFHASVRFPQPAARQNPFLRNPQASPPASNERLYVVIIDNDTNTYEQVIRICMKALQISEQEAFQIALAVDHNGEAVVFEGTRAEAQAVADIIRTIGIEVQLRPVV